MFRRETITGARLVTTSEVTIRNNIEQKHYRMSSPINRLLLLYALMALITIHSTHASPISIDTNPPSTQPIRAIHYQFDQKMDPYLQLFKFNSSSSSSSSTDYLESSQTTTSTGESNININKYTYNSATCNDGSPAGYYKRLNSHSKSWIIYLQGGGFCGSEEACQHRWSRSTHLMTSNFWQKSLSVDGILSSEPKDNPYLWNANHIYVPYCSSDSWTGLQEAASRSTTADQGSSSSSFAFMGSKIIERVLESLFDDLPRDSSLHGAKFILLAGDSAGATGVMMNLDKVNRLVQQRFASQAADSCVPLADGAQLCEPRQVPIVRGIADSGWFLDNEPYDIYQQDQPVADGSSVPSQGAVINQPAGEQATAATVDCVRQRCSPLQSIKQAMMLWNGQVPAACAVRHLTEPWRCYFGYRAYPSLKTPLFVVQWLYDEAQLMVDNIIRPGTNSQWNYVNKLVGELRASLENVTALFAPSCMSHSLIVKQSWNQININGFKLPHILNSWEEETLAGQPGLELLLQDEQDLQRHIQHQFLSVTLTVEGVNTPQQSTISSGNLMALIGRDRLFDRLVALREQQQQQQSHQPKREYQAPNQQQQFEMRRSLSGTAATSQPTTTNSRARSRKKKRNNQQQSVPRTNAINSNRLSRSTTIAEDSTIVFNNNVPDVLVLSNSKQQEQGFEKFRLIDTCGWPQCNRDCPSMDLDLGFRSILPY